MTGHVHLLLTEVSIEGVRYCTEAATGKVWKFIEEPEGLVAHEVNDGDIKLAMAAEARRRYLDACVDEAALEEEVGRLWGDIDVIALDLPERWDDEELNRADTMTATVQTESASVAPSWWDVESLPPRTIDCSSLPSVTVEDDIVTVTVAAFGPPGRRPYTWKLVARFWDPEAEFSLATVLLGYDPDTHSFRGAEPCFVMTDLARWNEDGADFLLDVCGVYQGAPMIRDEYHQKSWELWRVVNHTWLAADDSLVPSPAVVDADSGPLVRISHRDRWVLIDPFGPEGDRGAPPSQEGWRRLGVVHFYRSAKTQGWLPDRRVENALQVDQILAEVGAANVGVDEEAVRRAHRFLRDTAEDALSESVAQPVREVIASTCDAFAQIATSTELEDLAERLRAADAEPAPRRRAQLPVLDAEVDNWSAQNLWLVRRQDAVKRLMGEEPDSLSVALLGSIPDHLQQRLASYPPPTSPADAPLLAELIAEHAVPQS